MKDSTVFLLLGGGMLAWHFMKQSQPNNSNVDEGEGGGMILIDDGYGANEGLVMHTPGMRDFSETETMTTVDISDELAQFADNGTIVRNYSIVDPTGLSTPSDTPAETGATEASYGGSVSDPGSFSMAGLQKSRKSRLL